MAKDERSQVVLNGACILCRHGADRIGRFGQNARSLQDIFQGYVTLGKQNGTHRRGKRSLVAMEFIEAERHIDASFQGDDMTALLPTRKQFAGALHVIAFHPGHLHESDEGEVRYPLEMFQEAALHRYCNLYRIIGIYSILSDIKCNLSIVYRNEIRLVSIYLKRQHFTRLEIFFCPNQLYVPHIKAFSNQCSAMSWQWSVYMVSSDINYVGEKPFASRNSSTVLNALKKRGVPAKDRGETGPIVIKEYSRLAISNDEWGS